MSGPPARLGENAMISPLARPTSPLEPRVAFSPRSAIRWAAIALVGLAAVGAAPRAAWAADPPRGGKQPKGDDDDDDGAPTAAGPPTMVHPVLGPPKQPLEISPEVRERIGSDHDGDPPSPTGTVSRRFLPYYEERRGDYRMRLLPPLWLEHSRGLESGAGTSARTEKTESLYGLVYYRRRSLKLDMDVLFPLAWRVRDDKTHAFVLGPIAHREAPGEHDNWLAPLVFSGKRPHGGYLHLPWLLATTHVNEKGAFTLAGPFFRDRTGEDVDWGVAPFVFRGDNGDLDGARKTYTLIPPLLTYHRTDELGESSRTVVGPLVYDQDPKRRAIDLLPFFYRIDGRPEKKGVSEHHTTLFPLFHYGKSDEQTLFVLPGYLRRVTPDVNTAITPIFTHSTTRHGATSFTAVGPIVPFGFTYRDRDIDLHAWAIAPFYYQSDSPRGHDFLTPLFGRFETYGTSRSYWFFPTITASQDLHGWSTNVYPIAYVGRSNDATHTVLAPVLWDFASPRGRTSIVFPAFWRFADTDDKSVVQVAANTLYMQKRVRGGIDWQFHLLPAISFGAEPRGHFWNLLFGLAGYQRKGSYARIRAFWIPIQVAGPSAEDAANRAARR